MPTAPRRRDPLLLGWILLLIPALAGSLVWAALDLRTLLPLLRTGWAAKRAEPGLTRLICRSSDGSRTVVSRYGVRLDPPLIQLRHDDGSHWHTYQSVEASNGGVMARYSHPMGDGIHNRHLWFSADLSRLHDSTIWIRSDPPGQIRRLPPPSLGRCQPDPG